MMKLVVSISALAALLLFGSCREVIPFEQPVGSVNGYEMRGRVTSINGVPVESVAVSLDYDFDVVGDTPMDTIPFVEPNPPKVIQVDAYDYLGRHVRQIYTGILPTGPVPRFFWQGYDDANQLLPSGKYLVRYVLDTTIVKIVPVLIRRHVTTFTDAHGDFVIKNANLPIGQTFDLYSSTTPDFLGVVRVTKTVYLLFQRSTLSRSASATLQVNNVYHGAYTIE